MTKLVHGDIISSCDDTIYRHGALIPSCQNLKATQYRQSSECAAEKVTALITIHLMLNISIGIKSIKWLISPIDLDCIYDSVLWGNQINQHYFTDSSDFKSSRPSDAYMFQ